MVEAVRNLVGARSVSVEPATEDDWEILELQAQFLEQQILNQINIIFPGTVKRIPRLH
jgi:peroxin-1